MKKFDIFTLELRSGPMAGLILRAETVEELNPWQTRVVYKAADSEFRVTVLHRRQKGKYTKSAVATQAQASVSRVTNGNVLWDPESGYKERTSGRPLRWDYQLANFVLDLWAKVDMWAKVKKKEELKPAPHDTKRQSTDSKKLVENPKS